MTKIIIQILAKPVQPLTTDTYMLCIRYPFERLKQGQGARVQVVCMDVPHPIGAWKCTRPLRKLLQTDQPIDHRTDIRADREV